MAKKKNETILECPECKARHYWMHKKSGPNPEKLSLKKFCRHCRKHTLHVEAKTKKPKK